MNRLSEPSKPEKTDARRLVEASAWRTWLTERELDSSPEFEAWLGHDIKNQRAWSHVQSSWDFFGEQATAPELLDLRRKALSKARSAGRERWRHGRSSGHWKRWALAASVASVAVVAALVWNFGGADVYRTDAGERRQVTLSDGSRVQLDASTELRVRYSDRARELTLKKGQARFDVAHDVERPFLVLAGGRKVIATGTAFNVDLLGTNLLVTLIEGRVVILRQEAAPKGSAAQAAPTHVGTTPSSGSAEASAPIELTAGQQLSVSASGSTSVKSANVERATAWESGQLVFEDEPLSTVIERVNRYAGRQLSLKDEQTASLKISGVFNTGDIDGFVTTLTHYLPIEAEVSADAILLSHR